MSDNNDIDNYRLWHLSKLYISDDDVFSIILECVQKDKIK